MTPFLGLLRYSCYTSPNAVTAFRIISQYSKVFDPGNRELGQYIFSHAAINTLARNKPEIQTVMSIPTIFKELADFRSAPRMFQTVLTIMKTVLESPGQDVTAVSYFLSVIEILKDAQLIDPLLLAELTETVVDSQHRNQGTIYPGFTLRIMLQLIQLLAKFFFQTPALPIPFQLRQFEIVSQSKDLMPYFQRAMPAISQACGLDVARLLIYELYKFFKAKVEKLSKPSSCPFGTIAQWLWDIPANSKEYVIVKNLLEPFQPMNDAQFLWTIESIQLPVHSRALNFLKELIETTFPHLIASCRTCRATCLLFLTNEGSLIDNLCRFDWFSIPESIHIEFFLIQSLPLTVSSLLQYAKKAELSELVVGVLQSIDLSSWLMYYLKVFPSSPLSDCFWAISRFTNESAFASQNYLDVRNFLMDSLGLLKLKFLSLDTAASFQQLNLYCAAKASYLSAMDSNPDSYFIAFVELRRIVLNLTAPRTAELHGPIIQVMRESPNPNLLIPFMENARNSPSDFTRTLSHVYLPFVMRASLQDEAYLTIKALQQRSARTNNPLILTDLLRLWTSCWTKSLDSLTALSSAILWHLTMLQEFSNGLDQSQDSTQSVKDAIRRNNYLFTRLLMKSGATTLALKQLQCVAQPRDIRQLTITEENLPRIQHFLRLNSNQAFYSLRFLYHIALHDFSACQHISNLNRQWLPVFLSLLNTSVRDIDSSAIFQKISMEMNGPDPERLPFYMSLCIYLVRINPILTDSFITQVLSSSPRDELRLFFLRWLIHLIQLVKPIPDEVLFTFFQTNPSLFYLLYRHAKSLNMNQLDDVIEKIKTKKEFYRPFLENESTFRWVAHCQDDIRTFAAVVQKHLDFYSDVLMKGDPEDIFEAAKICRSHPPVFRVSSNISFWLNPVGYKFPNCSQWVIALDLQTNRDHEAYLEILSPRGDKLAFPLISPKLYGFDLDEWLFQTLIARMVENHQSSRGRTRFLTEPLTFLLTPDLLIVYSWPIASAITLCDRRLPQLLAEARIADFDGSPLANKLSRHVDIDKDFLHNTYIRAAEGSKITFLYLRQCFAAQFGALCFLRFMFRTPLTPISPLNLFGETFRVTLPGFFQYKQGVPIVPMTQSMLRLIPKFMLLGSFAASWNTMADALWRHRTKLRIILHSLRPVHVPKEAVEDVVVVCGKLASQVREEADKVDRPFPFVLMNHLVETAGNSLLASPGTYGWI
jgi:hypothetical protein